jgi:phage shock protein A
MGEGAFLGLLFGILWLWVVIAGIKAVGRRLLGFFTGWSSDRSYYPESRAWHVPTPVTNQPLAAATSDIWTSEERRTFGRKLAAAPVVSTDAVVGEMQRELAKLVRHASDVERNLARWRAELHRVQAAQADWQDRAALAVDKGRDQLARAALEQKAKLDPRAEGLQADIGRLEGMLADYRRDILVLENKLSESIRRQVLAESRLAGAEGSARARELVFGERTAAALSDLEQVERAADLAEGRAEAMMIGTDPPGLAGEFAALEKQEALDRELAALKAQRQRPAA